MASLQKHFRNTFLAGVVAAVPLAVTGFAVWYLETHTRFISERILGQSVPFLGILLAIVAIYLIGLAVRSLLGRIALRIVDAVLSRLPGLKAVYSAWKHIALTSGAGAGMFDRVVLIELEDGLRQLGLTNGAPVGPEGALLCVFVPACPNPLNGELYLVTASRCAATPLAAEEAFKMILSTGNFVPAGLGRVGPSALTAS
jgi:uncharacterized membrane protein